jgi:hypothetical protein
MVKEIVVKNAVKREKGYLYFVDAVGNIVRSKMGRGKSKVKEKPAEEKSEDAIFHNEIKQLERLE